MAPQTTGRFASLLGLGGKALGVPVDIGGFIAEVFCGFEEVGKVFFLGSFAFGEKPEVFLIRGAD